MLNPHSFQLQVSAELTGEIVWAASKRIRLRLLAEKSHDAAEIRSPIVAWLADGLPVYGPYGYASPMDPKSGLRRMTPGYVKRDGTNGTTNLGATGRTTLPAWAARAQNRRVEIKIVPLT